MGSDRIVLAELRFPKGGAAKWKEQVIEEDAYDDWPRFIAGSVDASTVEALLAEMKDPADFLSGSPHEILRSQLKGDSYSLRLLINEDDFRARRGSLATLLRLAGRVPGALGQIYFLASDGDDGVVIRIKGGRSSVAKFGWLVTRSKPIKGDLMFVDEEVSALLRAQSALLRRLTRQPKKKPATAKAKKPAKKARR